MKKFEYTRVVAIRNLKLKSVPNQAIYDVDAIEHDHKQLIRVPLVDYLNRLGREGWEIRASDSSETTFSIILQRELKSE